MPGSPAPAPARAPAPIDVPAYPVTPLHFTITPPASRRRLLELTGAELEAMFQAYRRLTGALRNVHGCTGFNLLINDGRYARTGQRDEPALGEIREEDDRLRFHVFGRKQAEGLAPFVVLNDPDASISEVDRADRDARLENLWSKGSGPSPDAPPEASGDAGVVGDPSTCTLCAPDVQREQEILRVGGARVIRPRRPLVPSNVMLAPLRHVSSLAALTPDEQRGLFLDLFGAFARGLGMVERVSSFNLFVNDGRSAGQHVPHVHVHVFGRSAHEPANPYVLLAGMRWTVRR